MPKHKSESTVNFGERLVELRKATGLHALELVNEVGASRRMIVYSEGQSAHLPT